MIHLVLPDSPRRRDTLLANLGAQVAGIKKPTGIVFLLADALVSRAGATLLFDPEGDPVPLPPDLRATTLYPKGVRTISAAPTDDGRMRYTFPGQGPVIATRFFTLRRPADGTTEITV